MVVQNTITFYYVYIFSSPCIDEIFECRNGLILIFCDLRNIRFVFLCDSGNV